MFDANERTNFEIVPIGAVTCALFKVNPYILRANNVLKVLITLVEYNFRFRCTLKYKEELEENIVIKPGH